MLFSRKNNVFKLFGCLKIRFTENQFQCLVRSNIFTENALHSQATQFSIHFLSYKHVDNESIPHSFTKETKPSKKIHQIRSNWDRAAEEKLRSHGGGEIKRRDAAIDERHSAAIDDRRGVIVGLELGLWLPAKSLLPLSLRSGLSLLSLSLSPKILWSENENWIHFPPQKPYFTVKLKIFSVWPNLPNLPNMLFSKKGFLNSIWSQNKRTLSPYPITSHVNIISMYKKCL